MTPLFFRLAAPDRRQDACSLSGLKAESRSHPLAVVAHHLTKPLCCAVPPAPLPPVPPRGRFGDFNRPRRLPYLPLGAFGGLLTRPRGQRSASEAINGALTSFPQTIKPAAIRFLKGFEFNEVSHA